MDVNKLHCGLCENCELGTFIKNDDDCNENMNNKRIRDFLKLLLPVHAIIGVKTESRAGKSRARKKSWKASFCNFSLEKLALLP